MSRFKQAVNLRSNAGRLTVAGLIVALVAGISLLNYGFIGHYVRYLADDYCTAAIMHQNGFWPTQLYWYISWTGRFSFTLGVSIVELFGMKAATILPALLITASAAATGWALLGLRKTGRPTAPSLAWATALALCITLGIIGLTPNLIQSFYWQTGSLTYFAPLVMFTLAAGCVLHASHSKQPRGLAILAGLLAFAAAGFSESFSLIQVGLLIYAVGLCALVYPNRQRLIATLAAAAGSIIGLIVVIVAPGNTVRFTNFPDHQPPLTTLSASIQASRDFIHSALSLPLPRIGLISIVAVAAIFAITLDRQITRQKLWQPLLQLVLAPIMAFAVVVVSYYPVYYGYTTKTIIPDRILMVPAFGLILAAAYIGICLGLCYRSLVVRRQIWLAVLLIVAGTAVLVSYSDHRKHIYDTKQALQYYSLNWAITDTQLRNAASANAVITYLPAIGGSAELQPDPTNWYNGCIADYYGLKSVQVQSANTK